MNSILFDESEAIAQDSSLRVTVSDRRATHAFQILKVKPGDTLRVGQLHGLLGTARVVESAPETLIFETIALRDEPPAENRIELILALPRPKSLKRCLRGIANLGIKSVHLINSGRVDKSYWTAPALQPETLHQTLLEGLSIARDTILPTIKLHKLFKPFAQDIAPHLVQEDAFVTHPDGAVINAITERRSGLGLHRIPVAIGPEGGFTEYEVGLLGEAGFKKLSLGSRIYSVENAVPFVASLFRH